jgi:hypothetical protein
VTIEEAKRKIFNRLCQELQEPGSYGWMPIHDFHIQAGIPHDLFQKALVELRTSSDRDLFIEISRSTQELRLGANGRESCKQGCNPFYWAARY